MWWERVEHCLILGKDITLASMIKVHSHCRHNQLVLQQGRNNAKSDRHQKDKTSQRKSKVSFQQKNESTISSTRLPGF
jgi:hypothetical protein